MKSAAAVPKMIARCAVIVAIIAGGTAAASAQVVPGEVQAALNASTVAVVSAVSRPSAPFVTGLATDSGPNTCGVGAWTRGQGGYVRSTSGGTTVDVRYGGVIAAADYSCFDVNGTGLDLSAGFEAGKLWGAGNSPGTPASYATLDQTFLAGYATAAKDGMVGVLEVRREVNTFTAQGIPTLPNGAQVHVSRTILNAAGLYNIELQDGFSLTPSLGVSVIGTDGASTVLAGTTITLNGSVGAIGFASLTLAKAIILPDQVSAMQPFARATYYHDAGTGLSGSVTSNGVTTPGTVPGTGSYGEIGVGLNYVRLLDGDGPRQASGTLRGDAKFNGSFYGLSLTGQARVQF